jgi:hypothetical protein
VRLFKQLLAILAKEHHLPPVAFEFPFRKHCSPELFYFNNFPD